MIGLRLGPATTATSHDAYTLATEVWNRPAPHDWTQWTAALDGLPAAPQKDIPVAVVTMIWEGWTVIGAARYFKPADTAPQVVVVLHHPHGHWAATSVAQTFTEVLQPRVGWHELVPEDQHHTALTSAEDHTFLTTETLTGFADGLASASRGDFVERLENHWVMPHFGVGGEKAFATAALRVLWWHCQHEDMDTVRTMAALGGYGLLPDALSAP